MFFLLAAKESTETDLCKLNVCTSGRLNVVTASSVHEGLAIAQTEKSDKAQHTAHVWDTEGCQTENHPTTHSPMPQSQREGI